MEAARPATRQRWLNSRALKLSGQKGVALAFTVEEKAALLAEAKARRSPTICHALMLALHAGMRDKETRGLQWGRVDLERAIVTVGESKTEAGEGRTIPLNADVLAALVEHSKWFLDKFGETKPEWYLFPFGKPQPTDPAKPCTSFKTVWTEIRKEAGVIGRWHDSLHTFITDLAESGEASEETIKDIAGHVSNRMLKHYSHIRMQAKRRATDSLVVKKKPAAAASAEEGTISNGAAKESAKVARLHY
jgi:integrase